MQVIVIASQKGGVWGTGTIAVHLATEAAEHRTRTLILDLDPQGSAMEWANRRGDAPRTCPGRIRPAWEGNRASHVGGLWPSSWSIRPHMRIMQRFRRHARPTWWVISCRPSTFDIAAISATLDLCKLADKQALVGAERRANSLARYDGSCRGDCGEGWQGVVGHRPSSSGVPALHD